MECGLRNAENVQRVKCGFIPHEYSAFYTFAIFRIPHSAFYRCPRTAQGRSRRGYLGKLPIPGLRLSGEDENNQNQNKKLNKLSILYINTAVLVNKRQEITAAVVSSFCDTFFAITEIKGYVCDCRDQQLQLMAAQLYL